MTLNNTLYNFVY